MKELTRFSAALNHRHYGEGAYEHQKQQPSLEDLKIMTYGAAVSARSLFFYANEYLSRATGSRPILLLGLAGVAELNAQEQQKLARTVITIANRNGQADVYLHAACHIKLLSHDGVAYLGSQNLSNGAEPYFKGADSKKEYFHRFHEVILKVDDTDLHWVDVLFDRVLADHPLWVKVTPEHTSKAQAEALVARFVNNAQLKRIIDNLTAAFELDEFLRSSPEIMPLEFSPPGNAKLCKDIAGISAEKNQMHHLASLKSNVFFENDFSWCKDETVVAELLEIISALTDGFQGKSVLEKMLEDDTPLYLCDENDQRLIDSISTIASRHDLEDLDEYVEKHRDSILYSVIESPDYSEAYMFGAIDNDGNVDETMLRQRLSSTVIEWEWGADDELVGHERYVALDEKQNLIDTTKLWEDICAAFSTEIKTLWANRVLEQAHSLSTEIKKLYEHELNSESFVGFLQELRSGKKGQWSSRWTK
ncbi:hypothetical protein [Pseudomonas sp. 9Ag]|uniref:hypothetical protein n=1 Tax=Pseudomonas sp. 9Ag TaxID=2653167 RepID=UPI0012F25D94|nr:hypothetical protein [Pseudomonas sp. 9Ag]VXC43851.1 conserved hypothetical protein [Pseudomonas sp. 9Ag]